MVDNPNSTAADGSDCFKSVNSLMSFPDSNYVRGENNLLDEGLNDVGAYRRTSRHDHQRLSAQEQFPEHLEVR